MTMLLRKNILVPVEPCPSMGEDWFQICGRPMQSGCASAEDYLIDMDLDGDARVKSPRIVGLHDLHDDLWEDPRFSDEDDEENPSFGVVRAGAGYIMAIDVNVPEGLVLDYLMDQYNPEDALPFPEYKPQRA